MTNQLTHECRLD